MCEADWRRGPPPKPSVKRPGSWICGGPSGLLGRLGSQAIWTSPNHLALRLEPKATHPFRPVLTQRAQAKARAFLVSTPGGIRTHDLCLRRAALYPAELRAHQVGSARNKPSSVRRIGIASRHRPQRGGIISLGHGITAGLKQPTRDSDGAGHASSPIWPCSGWGLPCDLCYQRPGALLPHPFTLACAPCGAIGGLLSAALSVALRRPGVTRHPALWSSDFPPAEPQKGPPAIPTRTLPTDTKSGRKRRILIGPYGT